MATPLYPLTFVPVFKERVWGGRNLARLYGKPLPAGQPIGESWEITDRPEGTSVIANGPLAGRDLRWLMERYPMELLGRAQAPGGRFPLLVKILDARELLSIQVHPPATIAAQLGGEPKTELWYVTHAGPGAELYVGLTAGVDRTRFERALADGSVADCVHRIPVRVGDAMFLPSGRIHALGANLVIFEIQQNSDTTYRVFDWNRVGPDGRRRELHIAQALACIDFSDVEPALVQAPTQLTNGLRTRRLVESPLFAVTECRAEAGWSRAHAMTDRPLVVGVVDGQLWIEHPTSDTRLHLAAGQFGLLPAAAGEVRLEALAAVTFLSAEPGADSPSPRQP